MTCTCMLILYYPVCVLIILSSASYSPYISPLPILLGRGDVVGLGVYLVRSPPPPQTPIEPGGTYARSPSPEPPYLGKRIYPTILGIGYMYHWQLQYLAAAHPRQGNSVKSDVHFGHFEGLDFYCQWGQLGFKVCMMCMGTSTIITLIIRVTPCFILEKCVKNTMVLDVRARNDFFTLSCSCSKLCDVWGLTLKLIPVLITWSIGLYNIHKHYL